MSFSRRDGTHNCTGRHLHKWRDKSQQHMCAHSSTAHSRWQGAWQWARKMDRAQRKQEHGVRQRRHAAWRRQRPTARAQRAPPASDERHAFPWKRLFTASAGFRNNREEKNVSKLRSTVFFSENPAIATRFRLFGIPESSTARKPPKRFFRDTG